MSWADAFPPSDELPLCSPVELLFCSVEVVVVVSVDCVSDGEPVSFPVAPSVVVVEVPVPSELVVPVDPLPSVDVPVELVVSDDPLPADVVVSEPVPSELPVLPACVSVVADGSLLAAAPSDVVSTDGDDVLAADSDDPA